MLVREAMADTFSTAQISDSVESVARLMVKEDCGFIPVLDGQRLSGVITDRDIVTHCVAVGHGDALKTIVGDVMSRNVHGVRPDQTLKEAAHLMAQHRVRRLPVMEGDRLVGILSHGNLVQALHGQGAAIEATLGVTAGA